MQGALRVDCRGASIWGEVGGTFGAFDNLHQHDHPAAFAEYIGRTAATAYGTAGLAFVERLLADLHGALDAVTATAKAFSAQAAAALDLPAEGQTRRALERFYYVAADVWAKEVHAGADPKQAARAVQEAGFLVADAGGRFQTKAPRAAGRARCYCLRGEIMGSDDG